MGDPISREELKTELRDALRPLRDDVNETRGSMRLVSDRTIEISTRQEGIKARQEGIIGTLDDIKTRLTSGDQKLEHHAVDIGKLKERVDAQGKRAVGGGGLGGLTAYGVMELIKRALHLSGGP